MTRRGMLATLGSLPLAAGVGALVARGSRSVLGAMGAGGGAARYQAPTMSARQMVQQQHLPNVRLVTQDGKTVRFYDDLVKDKKVVINFLNTQQPQNCSAVTTNLVNLQKLFTDRMGKDMHMYSISLNPKDTPATLKAWAEQHGAGPGWTFLTGRPADLENLRQGLGMVYVDDFEDTNPAAIASIVRFGSEPDMRWAHEVSLAHPREIAHKLVFAFGSDPNVANAPPSWFCGQFNK